LLSLANAVLSRCEIRYNLVQRLPKTPEIEFKGHVFEVSRNILLSRPEIPGLGKINVIIPIYVPTVSDHAGVFVRLGLP